MRIINAADFQRTIRQLADTAKIKADALDEAFLKRADPRAVQGGDIDAEAGEWRELAGILVAAAKKAAAISSTFGEG